MFKVVEAPPTKVFTKLVPPLIFTKEESLVTVTSPGSLPSLMSLIAAESLPSEMRLLPVKASWTSPTLRSSNSIFRSSMLTSDAPHWKKRKLGKMSSITSEFMVTFRSS